MTKPAIVNPAVTAAAIFEPAKLVDELGMLKAQIAALEAREKEITDAIKAVGGDAYSGTLYDCSISRTERETVDTKRLREDLGEEIIAGYIKRTPITTLKVTAKK